MFLARLPGTAVGITLTLHVVTGLGRGYGAAGLVGTATTLGSAIGAPVAGRLIDRHGLRPVVATCGLASTGYYLATPHLPYEFLVLIALPAGMFAVPLGSISRQVLTALVPPPHRRPAYTLDSISIESSFMIGPTVGIAVSTQISSTAALTGLGLTLAIVTVVLCLRNPPIRHPEDGPAGRPPLRTWLTPALAATLIVIFGALFCLIGTEVAVLAALRATGEVAWTGVVITLMCVASIAGGMVHGAVRRSLSQPTLMVLLSVLVIPAGLFPHPWWLLALALVPTNLLCAPTLSATAEQIGELAPPGVRGQAMGLLDSATRLGVALGNPVVGFAIDHSTPAFGFAAAGSGGVVIAFAGLAVRRFAPARTRQEVPQFD
ncbi:MFS transporter [Amycolatopsis pigmentata]|uniref:MFS transporter n=1 Tax=Amycolatopsis pigmentata TaxID=450801 RepID=A0ABW5FS61_9PSEU